MRFMCDEFRASHTDETGSYLPTSLEEFEITIMTHFIDRPNWLGNAPRGVVRTWALDTILSSYPYPKRNTLSLMWLDFKQWFRRKLNLVVRMSDEQKEYFTLMVYLFGINRDVRFVNGVDQIRFIESLTQLGTSLVGDDNAPVIIAPIIVKDPKSHGYMTNEIYFFNTENIGGDVVAKFLGLLVNKLKENEESKNVTPE